MSNFIRLIIQGIMNKKGFAISTILYGLVFLTVAIFYMIIAVVSNRNEDNNNFVNEVREELNNK